MQCSGCFSKEPSQQSLRKVLGKHRDTSLHNTHPGPVYASYKCYFQLVFLWECLEAKWASLVAQ